MKLVCFIYAGLVACAAAAASAGVDGRLGAVHSFTSGTEAKIQAQVLDRMLGPGKAYIFLETAARFKGAISEELKDGVGETRRVLSKDPAGEPAEGADWEKGVSSQEQRASQQKRSVSANDAFELTVSSMSVRILHDASVPAKKLEAVKAALLALYPDKLKAGDVVFVPAAFEPAPAR
ncbi:MAG: hypothetical protein A3J79_06565 [Elusimicrobia bacterium RIFOXYB2_FULL_62_6]|nr:MAG: hypothetical protein A3J79_06565 [Elusimicrobia bacterium RIFOXYB2_FULL_62_6]